MKLDVVAAFLQYLKPSGRTIGGMTRSPVEDQVRVR